MDVSKEWLEAIFKREAMEKIVTKVVGFESSSAVGKGNNYLSEMTRLKVDVILGSGKKIKKSVLIKQIPMTEKRKAMITELGVYRQEIMMYRDIFSIMENVLAEMDGKEDLLWGKCIDYRPYDRLVLEDLTEYGYKMANKLEALDLQHCKIALSKLAKFHALSVVLKERNLISLDNLGYNVFYPNNKGRDQTMNELMLSKKIESCEKIYGPEWKPLFERLGKKWLGKVGKLFYHGNHRDDSKFAVLVHGDFWTNNMLFKYDDDGKPLSVKFVDFQLSFYQCPGHDLQRFFVTSPTSSVQESHLDELVAHYHENLVKYMKRFNCATEIPTLADIQSESLRFAPFGLAIAIFVLPYMTVDRPDDMPDLEDVVKKMAEMEKKGVVEHSVYLGSETYHEKFKIVLKNAEKMGVI